MGEFESRVKYAKSVGADVSRPKIDRRHTSQRVTDEMRELRKRAELSHINRASGYGRESQIPTSDQRVPGGIGGRCLAGRTRGHFGASPCGESGEGMNYAEFLKRKTIVDPPTGHNPTTMPGFLYDFQKAITRWAIRRGRAAIFADCGLGKTPMQLEWARSVVAYAEQPVLILAPLAVSKQTQREGDKFGISVNICESQKDVTGGINITNYEKLHKFDPSIFSGIVLDESSILKSYTGKFRSLIISKFQNTPYRLACTATPAPNDFMELGNHCEFLGVMTRSEMLSMFFINDASDTGTWRLKKYGIEEFWKWVCSWAVMLSKPSDLGFEDNGFILPELKIHSHIVEHGEPLPGRLFVEKVETLSDRRKARKETVDKRIQKAVEIIGDSTDQWLIWCDLNIESEKAKTAISEAVEVTGSDSPEKKEADMLGFSAGKVRTLVTKSKIAGFGMNWQNCYNVIFLSLSDSYEQYYQAVRRCWRFGQEHPVNVHIITADVEGNVVDNVARKEADAMKMRDEMVKNMQDITSETLRGQERFSVEYKIGFESGQGWEMHLGDCVEIVKKMKSDSIGYSIFSPPFASLFTYSNSIRDMGNCKDKDDFLGHFSFLVDELYRIIMPGRLVSIHCMNLPALKSHDGFIGMKDFRGEIIYLFEKHGFIFHSEICIWKDPLIQAVRTKNLTLAHKQVVKDSSRCAQGFPDYIVTMRKPGENPKPISRGRGFEEYIGEKDPPKAPKNDDPRRNKFSHEVWQRYASPVWFDIRQTRVLSTDMARDDRDEKHVCPLQLDTIERCLELWSAEGDTVLSPFVGIGSEIYCAAKMGRYGIGIELKESYFKQAIKNLKRLELSGAQQKLFA